MPMPKFPYAQGRFLRLVAHVMATERARAKQGLQSGKDVKALAEDRASTSNPPERRLSGDDLQHFVQHWLTGGGGNSSEFPSIPIDRMMRVLKEGFRRAVEAAEDKKYGGSPGGPLAITVAWICNADPNTFEVVNVVSPGLVVQTLIVTPPPPPHPGHKGTEDNVIVTRWFETADEIRDFKQRLSDMGDPSPKIEDEKDHPTKAGELGTFEIWT